VNLFVFGLGYSAGHFVARDRERFDRVSGTVRSTEKAAAVNAAPGGVEAFVFADGRLPEAAAAALAEADALIVSIAPGPEGDVVLAAAREAIARAPRLRWIAYLSTVGVYGDHGGAWVDESAPLNASMGRTRQRVLAEEAWLALGRETGKAVQVFRLAGIYGPGRSPLAKLLRGEAQRIIKPGQVFNRIHVEDIAAALAASLARPSPGAIYNVADDEPAPPQDVVTYAAELAGIAPPPEVPFAEAELSPMARSFYADNRRVSNRRLREELGVSLAYPTYREGIAALARAELAGRG